MSRFNSLFAAFLLTFSLAAGLSARATDESSRPAYLTSRRDASRAAYVMAWRNAKEATEHTDALRLTALMAERIGLAPGPAYDALGSFLDRELSANPGRFTPTEDPQAVLDQLLREDVGGFQRTLSPLAPEDAFQRYLQLLDTLHIKA